ncbi:AAA family ATPase [Candidatus Micrarchaeota archaeon]|nr:AAA family ATPase [Candidatus Micrarchaeota archaeon]
MRIALTGVPGTGKTAISYALGKKGFEVIHLNEIVEGKKLWKEVDEFGSKIVNMRKLQLEANRILRGKRNCIVEGHLACDMKLKCDLAIVCRTKPEILERRLRERDYPERKLNGNMLCELLDYCTIRSLDNYKKVYEIETSGSMKKNVEEIMKIIRGRGERFRAGWVNWGKELRKAVRS